jgi:hypothetical protein
MTPKSKRRRTRTRSKNFFLKVKKNINKGQPMSAALGDFLPAAKVWRRLAGKAEASGSEEGQSSQNKGKSKEEGDLEKVEVESIPYEGEFWAETFLSIDHEAARAKTLSLATWEATTGVTLKTKKKKKSTSSASSFFEEGNPKSAKKPNARWH